MTGDDLLARLNKLKPSAVPSLSRNNVQQQDPEDELVNRFLRFRSVSPPSLDPTAEERAGEAQGEGGDTVTNEEDHKTLKELLAGVPSSSEWHVDPEDEHNIKKLISEAQKQIPVTNTDENVGEDEASNENQETLTGEGEGSEQGKFDDALADDYLQQILDELDTEGSPEETANTDPKTGTNGGTEDPKQSSASPPLQLPSAPSYEPPPLPPVEETFSLPSAPSAAPTTKPKPGKTSKTKGSLPKYTDEEIESWCIICCDDASLKCLGCDGDLYCDKCWREGHKGPDVGFEERAHRATRFNKPKKDKEAGMA